ncbi:uncharacterized protein [Nothobranchius furzeri]|uniref:uncharacterized protein n=1 Tax=Nothobranchius furzeri TaxID=105023 RepID=UPI003904B1BC
MAKGGDRSAQDIYYPSKKTKREHVQEKVSVKGSNASNLMTHLRDHHPQLYSQRKLSHMMLTSVTCSSMLHTQDNHGNTTCLPE